MNNYLIGRRIKDARRGAGLTQGAVGKLLDPTRTHAAVSDIERGVTQITVDLLDQFARIFGAPVDHLLGTEPASSTRMNDEDAAWAARWLGVSVDAVRAMPVAVARSAAGLEASPPPPWLRQTLTEIGVGQPGEAIVLWRLLTCVCAVL